ncbi:hypothetical protein D3C81_729750 [compost metagenome]
MDRQAVRLVRRQLDRENLIIQIQILTNILADRGVVRQDHQAAVVLGQLQFARRAQHAVAFHAAQLADLDLERRTACFRRRQHGADHGARHQDARLDVGRAADDLERLAGAGIHLADVEAVSVGVALGGQHTGHDDLAERRRNGANLFHLEPGHGQAVRQRVGRDLFRIGESTKPGFRELHGASDPVGIL